jgi:hypothetical protein
MMDDILYEQLINVPKATKCIKDIGLFMLTPVTADLNLVATACFVLQLNDKQFFELECKLEVKEQNRWLYKSKDGLTPANGTAAEDVKTMFFDAFKADSMQTIHATGLSYTNGCRIYTDGCEYIGMQEKFLNMFTAGVPVLKRAPGHTSIIVDDRHILAPVNLGRKEYRNQYLRDFSEIKVLPRRYPL